MMPIYMQYDGVDGSVTSAGHDKWIQTSAQLPSVRTPSSPHSGGANFAMGDGSVRFVSSTVDTVFDKGDETAIIAVLIGL